MFKLRGSDGLDEVWAESRIVEVTCTPAQHVRC